MLLNTLLFLVLAPPLVYLGYNLYQYYKVFKHKRWVDKLIEEFPVGGHNDDLIEVSEGVEVTAVTDSAFFQEAQKEAEQQKVLIEARQTSLEAKALADKMRIEFDEFRAWGVKLREYFDEAAVKQYVEKLKESGFYANYEKDVKISHLEKALRKQSNLVRGGQIIPPTHPSLLDINESSPPTHKVRIRPAKKTIKKSTKAKRK